MKGKDLRVRKSTSQSTGRTVRDKMRITSEFKLGREWKEGLMIEMCSVFWNMNERNTVCQLLYVYISFRENYRTFPRKSRKAKLRAN